MSSTLQIGLVTPNLAHYPQGGGHWSCFLQYLIGLRAIGHNAYILEQIRSSGKESLDRQQVQHFFAQMARSGVAEFCWVIVWAQGRIGALDDAILFGVTRSQFEEFASTADILWNFAGAAPQELLQAFKRRAYIDVDPGVVQVSGLSWDLGLDLHDRFLTVGQKLLDEDCPVPRLNHQWTPFRPFVFLPWWPRADRPGDEAALTSITQWFWGEFYFNGRNLSISKRDAYLRYLDIPQKTQRRLELAANIHKDDKTGDRALLLSHGWNLVDPHERCGSPEDYAKYIAASFAEFSCPKPIYRELRTGWLSDRSVAYLASGRPVLTEDTGAGDHIPTGAGLLTFDSMETAEKAMAELESNYAFHSRAARELAEEYFDSRVCLQDMLAASF